MKLRDLQYLIEPFDKITIFFENVHQEENWHGEWKDCHYMNCEIILIWANNDELNFTVKG